MSERKEGFEQNQWPTELARDMIAAVEEMSPGETITLQICSHSNNKEGGRPMIDWRMDTDNPKHELPIAEGKSFKVVKVSEETRRKLADTGELIE